MLFEKFAQTEKKKSSWSQLGIKKYLLFALLFWGGTPSVLQAKTPSHVSLEAEHIIADLTDIRRHKGVTQDVRVAAIQIAKTPIHVYTKGIELYQKVARLKKAYSGASVSVPELPTTKVTPTEVLTLLSEIRKHIADIKQNEGIANTEKELQITEGLTPSDAYQRVWQASFLMDGLVSAIKPQYVFENTVKITNLLVGLGDALGKNIVMPSREVISGKKPIDANIEGYKILFQLVELELKLNIPPLRVPNFPAGNVSPSDVFDTTNNILAELVRIKIKTPFVDSRSNVDVPQRITPNEVVGQLKVIQVLLEQINE